MGEFDELVSHPGVLMAGRFGPDGRVADHKSTGLFIENQAQLEMTQWFCSAVTTMFTAMAHAVDLEQGHGSGWDTTSWLPMTGWTYRGGNYAIAVHGSLFVFVEAAKIESLDDLVGLLHQLDS